MERQTEPISHNHGTNLQGHTDHVPKKADGLEHIQSQADCSSKAGGKVVSFT